jgi:hypothetical protein
MVTMKTPNSRIPVITLFEKRSSRRKRGFMVVAVFSVCLEVVFLLRIGGTTKKSRMERMMRRIPSVIIWRGLNFQ